MSETRKNSQLRKRKSHVLAIVGIVSVTIVVAHIYFFHVVPYRKRQAQLYESVCPTNLKTLGAAMVAYANESSNQYPAADKWCDLLIQGDYIADKQLVCPASDAIMGESSYAFNKYIVGKKRSEIAPDIVVLFETNFGTNRAGRQGYLRDREYYDNVYNSEEKRIYKLRWNQFGGLEILTTENHGGEGCNILFNNGHVEFVRTEGLGELKWKIEESKEKLQP